MNEIEPRQHDPRQLPQGYEFPLFSGRQVVESQRRSGYKDTARAGREIVDNEFEAGAGDVWIVFNRPKESERNRHMRRGSVSAIAFIDDGSGMLPQMARFAPSAFPTPSRPSKPAP